MQRKRFARVLLTAIILLLPVLAVQPAFFTPGMAVHADSEDVDAVRQVKDYLKNSIAELEQIESIINDPDLDLMGSEPDFDDDPDISPSEISASKNDMLFWRDLAAGYADDLQSIAIEAESVDTPKHDILLQFEQSHNANASLLLDVMIEYEQIMDYSAALIELSEYLDSINTNSADIYDVYEEISQALDNSIYLLEALEEPSFIRLSHLQLVDALTQMDESSMYLIDAADIYDPVMLDAGEYRLDILTRRFESVIGNIERDFSGRDEKLTADIETVERINSGLLEWSRFNLDRLERDADYE